MHVMLTHLAQGLAPGRHSANISQYYHHRQQHFVELIRQNHQPCEWEESRGFL